jgi:hypothetical protein
MKNCLSAHALTVKFVRYNIKLSHLSQFFIVNLQTVVYVPRVYDLSLNQFSLASL